MRLFVVAALGLAAGVGVSHLLAGCGCPTARLSAGTYYGVNGTTEADYRFITPPDSPAAFTLVAERSRATEYRGRSAIA